MVAMNTPSAPPRVAFLGLGTMGYPMAAHLARAGHAVSVFNRSAAKAKTWVAQHGGRAATSACEASAGADFVFACVGNDDDLRSVTLGAQGAFAGMRPGACFVDHTTASATVARELYAEARRQDLHFIDAPVSGGETGAVNGTLTVMCGGDVQAFESMRPLALTYARAVTRVGDSGAGQLAKMVNQVCVVGLLQALAEGLAFGRRAGLDMPLVLDIICKGAAQSSMMDHRGLSMLDGRFEGFGFAVEWMRKDLGLVLDEARRNGAKLPATALVDQFFADVQAAGGGRKDISSLIERLK
jgi:3-hydroxyisobutyrate dehydrogenase-like beta-hydroxyacid dehydrogenase